MVNKTRVMSIFYGLKFLEIGAFVFLPYFLYKLLIPYVAPIPIVSNIFLMWLLGAFLLTLCLFAIVGIILVGWGLGKILSLVIRGLSILLGRLFFNDWIELNMKWATRLAKLK